MGVLAVAATSGTALANPTCDSVTPALGGTVSCEYSGGGATTITVPPNTIRIDAVVRGGGGAAGGVMANRAGYDGGSGARVVAALTPSLSTALTVQVGRGGDPKGDLMGGAGGGFSAIYEGAGTTPSSVITVAGGGGGGGYGTRCANRGTGGQGGQGVAGAGGPGLGGDAPGAGGGGVGGSAGAGGAVMVPLSGMDGTDGFSWVSGGAGGVGVHDRGGDGGQGYGGGGGGGFVYTARALGCDVGGVPAASDGSGGGAGGSYVKPERLVGSATYDNSGGTAGFWTGGVSSPAQNGTVTLTFVGTTYTVTYDGNGSTGGTVGSDHWGPYLAGHIVTVCDNHRTDLTCDFPNDDRLTRDGYTFDGWNTAANGSGTPYAPTNTFAITGNTVLYAQWKAPAATTSPSTPATPVATPAATAPSITTPPVLRGAAVRCAGAACTTSGTLPAGATRVNQTATSGTRSLSREVAWATAATAKGSCQVKTTGKGNAAKRTYTCRIRLTKGTWTVTTTALSPTGAVVAQAVKVARVK